jgi:hypothetical protein
MATKNPYQGTDYDFFAGARDEEGAIKRETPKAAAPKQQSFSQAFAAAKRDPNNKGTFTWNGKSYTTEVAKPKASDGMGRVGPTKARAGDGMGRVGPTKARAAAALDTVPKVNMPKPMPRNPAKPQAQAKVEAPKAPARARANPGRPRMDAGPYKGTPNVRNQK